MHSDLGVHMDGFISNIAHSFVVGATKVLHSLLNAIELGLRSVSMTVLSLQSFALLAF